MVQIVSVALLECLERCRSVLIKYAIATWAESYTKLLAFNQTQYDRVLSLDSDSSLLQHMDELFLLPSVPLAMPRAYWLPQPHLTSGLLLIQPSTNEFARIQEAIETAKRSDYDMEIVNKLYGKNCMILPHRPYLLLTGEFRGESHANYLGNDYEQWNPEAVLEEAKFLHFSDWPVSKPWLHSGESVISSNQPKCHASAAAESENCTERDLWLGFYQDFMTRRQVSPRASIHDRTLPLRQPAGDNSRMSFTTSFTDTLKRVCDVGASDVLDESIEGSELEDYENIEYEDIEYEDIEYEDIEP